jgi:hypothetical protein
LQASYQMRLGKSASPVLPQHSADNDWKRYGFDDIREEIPGRLYKVRMGIRTFRVTLDQIDTSGDACWGISVDERERDGTWRSIEDFLHLPNDRDAASALHQAILRLALFARELHPRASV